MLRDSPAAWIAGCAPAHRGCIAAPAPASPVHPSRNSVHEPPANFLGLARRCNAVTRHARPVATLQSPPALVRRRRTIVHDARRKPHVASRPVQDGCIAAQTLPPRCRSLPQISSALHGDATPFHDTHGRFATMQSPPALVRCRCTSMRDARRKPHAASRPVQDGCITAQTLPPGCRSLPQVSSALHGDATPLHDGAELSAIVRRLRHAVRDARRNPEVPSRAEQHARITVHHPRTAVHEPPANSFALARRCNAVARRCRALRNRAPPRHPVRDARCNPEVPSQTEQGACITAHHPRTAVHEPPATARSLGIPCATLATTWKCLPRRSRAPASPRTTLAPRGTSLRQFPSPLHRRAGALQQGARSTHDDDGRRVMLHGPPLTMHGRSRRRQNRNDVLMAKY
jgi:hypothetical protein